MDFAASRPRSRLSPLDSNTQPSSVANACASRAVLDRARSRSRNAVAWSASQVEGITVVVVNTQGLRSGDAISG